jgi:hypothetical protein
MSIGRTAFSSWVGLSLVLSACSGESATAAPAPTSAAPAPTAVSPIVPPTSVAPAVELRVGRVRVLDGPEAVMPPLRRAVVLVDHGAAATTARPEGSAPPDTLGGDDEISVMLDAPLTPAPTHITLLGESGACEATVTAAWSARVGARAAPVSSFPSAHAYEAYVYDETGCAAAPPETADEAARDRRATRFDFGVVGAPAECEIPAMGDLPVGVARAVYFATVLDPEEGWSDASAAGYHGHHAADGTWLVRGGTPEVAALVLPEGRVIAGETAPCALHAATTTLMYLHAADRSGGAVEWGSASGVTGSVLPPPVP